MSISAHTYGQRAHAYHQTGFTLIELMFVVSIIALFSAFVLTAFDHTRYKARDTRRVTELESIQKALELYYITYNRYPDGDGDGGDGWDVGNIDHPLFDGGYMDANFAGTKPPVDVWQHGVTDGYLYRRYTIVEAQALGCKGAFYVLGVTDMESSGDPYGGSPGFSCGTADSDFQMGFDWVAGSYENN